MVLATAKMARVPRRNGGSGALALARSCTVGARIRGCFALRLGFRVDRTRNSRARGSPQAVGRRGLLPICAQPNVCRVRSWVDRAVDRSKCAHVVAGAMVPIPLKD